MSKSEKDEVNMGEFEKYLKNMSDSEKDEEKDEANMGEFEKYLKNMSDSEKDEEKDEVNMGEFENYLVTMNEFEKDVVNMSLDEQEEHYKLTVQQLPKEVVINQARQFINYERNYQNTRKPLYTMFENYSLVLKKNIKEDKTVSEEDFTKIKRSLDNSQDCVYKTENYMDKIENLGNDEKDFIIAPIWTRRHLFSAVVYKKDEENYEFVIVNKGGRDNEEDNHVHHSFERYIIPKENLPKVTECLNYEHWPDRSVTDVYSILGANSTNKDEIVMSDFSAREQRVGNCFYKEVEEGMKYAYSRALNRFYTKSYLNNNEIKEIKIPKVPNGTQKFHEEVLKNLSKQYNNEEVTATIDELIHTYNKNKEFRDITRNNKLSKEKQKEEFYRIFGDNKKENADNLEYLKECLSKVDERTLQDNIDFFVDILKENNVKIPMLMYSSKNNMLSIDFTTSAREYFNEVNKYNDLEFLKEYFPTVHDNLIDGIMQEKHNAIEEGFNDQKAYLNLIQTLIIEGNDNASSMIDVQLEEAEDENYILDLRVNKLKCMVSNGEKEEALKECNVLIAGLTMEKNRIDLYSKLIEIERETLKSLPPAELTNEYKEILDGKYNKETVDFINNRIKETEDVDKKLEIITEGIKIFDVIEEKEEVKNLYNSLLKGNKNDILHICDKENVSKLIEVLRTNNMSKEAIELIDNALPKTTNNELSKSLLKEKYNCLIDIGKKEAALDVCSKVLEEMKKTPETQDLKEYITYSLMAANLYKEMGNEEESLKLYENVINQFPKGSAGYSTIRANRKLENAMEELTGKFVPVLKIFNNTEHSKNYIKDLVTDYINKYGKQKLDDELKKDMTQEKVKELLGYNEDNDKEYETNKLKDKVCLVFKDEKYAKGYIKQLVDEFVKEHGTGMIDDILKQNVTDDNPIFRRILGYNENINTSYINIEQAKGVAKENKDVLEKSMQKEEQPKEQSNITEITKKTIDHNKEKKEIKKEILNKIM